MGVSWKELLAVLEDAKVTIHAWYGDAPDWSIYDRNAPEMKRLNGMIEQVRGMVPYEPPPDQPTKGEA